MATSTTTLGLRKPATTDTVDVSTDLNTPYDTIDDQFQKGSDVASATSITVPDEGYFDITGTTTTAGFSTVNAGIMKMVQFDGVLQLTHNSTSFNLPTGANITTAAGDRALFRSEGSGNWRCMWYQRASGGALAIADNSVDSDAYVDGSIDTAHLAADAVTGAKIADDALDSEHYTDGSIDAAHLASSAVTTAKINADAVTGAKIADDALDSEHYTDGSIDTAHIADNQVTLAKLSDGTQGGILYYASGGAPTELSAGTSGYYLKTQGASANPVWAAVASGGKIDQVSFTSGATGSTTSTSYADVSGGEVDITTDKGGLMAWYFLSGYNSSTSGNTYIALQLDTATEVAQSQVTQNLSNQDYVYSGFHAWTSVSDAAHEINIRMKVSAGTFTIRGGAILVMEFDD
tara:strand:- start:679 stop:1893 length:1215 start_codon:yes stop_codon:yes gene_type:complete